MSIPLQRAQAVAIQLFSFVEEPTFCKQQLWHPLEECAKDMEYV
jgi:hypothetical protein